MCSYKQTGIFIEYPIMDGENLAFWFELVLIKLDFLLIFWGR